LVLKQVAINVSQVKVVTLESGQRDIFVRPEESEGRARGVVEECMLIAGQVAARYARDHKIPFLFRAQVSAIRAVAGLKQSSTDGTTSGQGREQGKGGEEVYAAVARELTLQMQQLQGMPPAYTIPSHAPHYGLGLAGYAQITSPIRRYSDLLLHQQLRASLSGTPMPYSSSQLVHISGKLERRNRL
jgi:exoribonuclease-2